MLVHMYLMSDDITNCDITNCVPDDIANYFLGSKEIKLHCCPRLTKLVRGL